MAVLSISGSRVSSVALHSKVRVPIRAYGQKTHVGTISVDRRSAYSAINLRIVTRSDIVTTGTLRVKISKATALRTRKTGMVKHV